MAENGHKDDDDRKLFVGSLSWETTEKDLKEYFGKYGTVEHATVKTDQFTGRSRGFGFVTFSEKSCVEAALAEKNHQLHGRTIDPKVPNKKPGREPILKVFVGGLDPEVPESEVRTYFEQFGKVTEISLPYDKQKGQRRAFAFVTFETEEECNKAVAEKKRAIGGKECDVKKAEPKEQNQGYYGYGWGGYGGYSGYGGYGNYSGGYGGYSGGRGGGRGRGRGRGGYDSGYSNYGGGWNQGYNNGYEGYGDNYGYGYGNDYYGY